MALIVEELKKKIHIRDTDFFLKNYRKFNDDVDKVRIKEIVDVELEVLGYGVFNPQQLLADFMDYFTEMIRTVKHSSEIRSLKITINGFTLEPSEMILQKIAREIPNLGDNLSLLWIKTCNLTNTTLKDFNDLIRLSHQLSNINFEDFTLECASWTFTPNQPTFKDLRKIFESVISEAADITKILNKHFRIEMSGWYYTVAQAKSFLGFKSSEEDLKKIPEKERSIYLEGSEYTDELFFKELEKFSLEMERLITELLNVMDNIELLEFDMRNNNDFLKLKNLKKRLETITKDNRVEKSLISKRTDVNLQRDEKELRLNIMM